MKHFLRFTGRCALLLALMTCFCSSVWADDGNVYHIYRSAANFDAAGEPKRFDYTVKKVELQPGESQYTLIACKPVNASDFATGEAIDLILPNLGPHTVIGDELFAVDGDAASDKGFWEEHLASVQFPNTTDAVGRNIFLADSRTYKQLKTIDFSTQNVNAITFDERALYQLDDENALPHDAQVMFRDDGCYLTYGICPYTHEMKLVGHFDDISSKNVVLGEKSFGGLTGHLTSLGGVFKGYSKKDFSLAICDGLKRLDDSEFEGASLVAISLPKSLDLANADASCGNDVFKGCDKLQTVYAYNGRVPYVITKGTDGSFKADFDNTATYDFVPSAYATTDGLTNALFSNRWATVAGDITLQPYVTWATGFTADLDNCTTIGDDPHRSGQQLFAGNKAITSLTVTDQPANSSGPYIKGLAEQAFMGCTGLKSVKVVTNHFNSSSATNFELDSECFAQCTALTDVTVGQYVTKLSLGCFRGCTSLANLTFDEPFYTEARPMTLSMSCFEGCTSLVKADFRNRTIGYLVDNGGTLTTHTALEDRCFYGCSSLTTLLFNNDMEKLGTDIAAGTQLGVVYFVKRHNAVTGSYGTVADSYMWVKEGVESVDLPDDYRFRGSATCDGLTGPGNKILLCKVNTSEYNEHFDYTDEKTGGSIGLCDGNSEFSGKLCRVLDGAIYLHCRNVTLPHGVTLGSNNFNRVFFNSLDCYVDGNGEVTSDGNIHINAVPREGASTTGENMKVTVTGVYDGADCSSLTIPATINANNVTGTVVAISSNVLGSSAPQLQKLTIADSSDEAIQPLTVGDNAFASCANLTSVSLPKLRSYSLGASAFHDCTSLTSADLSGCTSIGIYAFSNCNSLASVRLGDKLCFVGGAAFGYTEVKSLVFKQPAEGLAYNYGSGTTQHVDAFNGADRLETVVFDMDPSRDNFSDTWKEFKNNMVASIPNHAMHEENVDVYITADAYDELVKDASNLSDMPLTTWHRAADYRLMATAAADGSALDKGYGTVCVPTPLAPSDSYNLKALFKAQLNAGATAVTLTPVETADVRAGQPYVFARSNDDASGLVVFAGDGKTSEGTKVSTPLADDALVGTFADTTAPKGSYVLQTDNMFHIVGGTSITVAPYRAYLKALPTSSAEARLSIVEGEPTAVKGVTDNADTTADTDAPMYNLSGQRIAAPVKGQIYVVKGKKVIKE